MTVAVANVALSDNFETWRTATNLMADAFRNQVLTVSNTTVSNTTGNAQLIGIFAGNTLVATDVLRGGNVSSSNTLQITSAVSVGNSIVVTGNSTLSGNITMSGNVVSTLKLANNLSMQNSVDTIVSANGDMGAEIATAQTIFSFDKTAYFSGEITVQARRSSNTHIQKGIIAQDGTTAYLTVFGTMTSPNTANLGIISANLASNGTHVDVRFLQTGISTSVKVLATLFK